ncbi:hypothetical protein [Actinopolymorpha alba]|nr:hypothetical protein [Actinopolymorpha alba]
MADLPEIAQAQVRHRKLVHRHGHHLVRDAYWTAQEIIDCGWSRDLHSP